MTEQRTREDWTKPAAMAIPKGGFDTAAAQQGRYGPIFPKSPTCYGFSILAKIIPGREEVFYGYARNIEKTIAAQPDALAVLKLHYLRWVLFPINGETYFMYQGIFDTDFDKYRGCRGAVCSDRHHYSLREPRGLPEGLEDQCAGLRQVRARAPVPQFS